MDALLSGTGVGTPSTGLLPETDLSVPVAITGQHIVPIITGSVEDAQQAQVLCNQVIGSIPQLPNAGSDWSTFFTGPIINGLGALDASIRANLAAGGHSDFYPDYSISPGGPNGDFLTVMPIKQNLGGA
jgi:hypothetical protein